MARQVNVTQSSREERIYPLDFSPALLEGVSVTDASLEYEGDNPDISLPTLDYDRVGNIVYVKVSGLTLGSHRVACIAETSNADLSPEIELIITVNR